MVFIQAFWRITRMTDSWTINWLFEWAGSQNCILYLGCFGPSLLESVVCLLWFSCFAAVLLWRNILFISRPIQCVRRKANTCKGVCTIIASWWSLCVFGSPSTPSPVVYLQPELDRPNACVCMCVFRFSAFACVLQIERMVQCVVIVFHVVVGQGVAADDQLQSVTGLCDQRYGQAAVEVPRPHVVHLDRHKNVGSERHFTGD